MASSQLDQLVAAHPSCRIAAHADLGTRIVREAAGAEAGKKDVLSRLCAEARLILGPTHRPPIGAHPCDLVMAAGEGETRIFFRSLAAPEQALICVCEPQTDLDAFLPMARLCATGIS